MTSSETPLERQKKALDDFAAGRDVPSPPSEPTDVDDDVPSLVWGAGDPKPSLEAELFALRLSPPEWDALFWEGNYGDDEEVAWLQAEIRGVVVRTLFTEKQLQALGSKRQQQLAVVPWAFARLRRYAELCIELGREQECSRAVLGDEGADDVGRLAQGGQQLERDLDSVRDWLRRCTELNLTENWTLTVRSSGGPLAMNPMLVEAFDLLTERRGWPVGKEPSRRKVRPG